MKTKLTIVDSDYHYVKYEYILNEMIIEFYNGKNINLQNNN